jgi:AcrR family transcriptional regulator
MTRERPYHHGNLRAALLDAAERSVEELGVEQLSLRELARTLGVSHAAPRGHFPDRKALLDALAERGFDRLAAGMRDAYARSGPEFEARLRATAAAYVAFASGSPVLLDLMYAGKSRGAAPGTQAAAAGAMSVVRSLIGEGIASGVLAPGDPERYAFLLFSWVRGIAALVASGIVRPDAVDELIADSVTTFIRGSARPQPEDRAAQPKPLRSRRP